jgi:hypothetical protein
MHFYFGSWAPAPALAPQHCFQVRRGYFIYVLCNFTGIGANINSTFTGPDVFFSWVACTLWCIFKGAMSKLAMAYAQLLEIWGQMRIAKFM